VYDAAADGKSSPPQHATGAAPEHATGAEMMCEEIEYPLPGSVASCDACGNVVSRY